MSTPRSRGAHGLRREIMQAIYHLEALGTSMANIRTRARELGADDQLAIAVRALRSIVSFSGADRRCAGLARGALRRMKVKP